MESSRRRSARHQVKIHEAPAISSVAVKVERLNTEILDVIPQIPTLVATTDRKELNSGDDIFPDISADENAKLFARKKIATIDRKVLSSDDDIFPEFSAKENAKIVARKKFSKKQQPSVIKAELEDSEDDEGHSGPSGRPVRAAVLASRNRKYVNEDESEDDGNTAEVPPSPQRKRGQSVKKEAPASKVPKVEEESDSEEEEDEELAEFQKIRLQNIREREAMFMELQLDEAKLKFEEAVKKVRTPKPSSKFTREKSPPLPRRKSLRIEGIKAEEPIRAAEQAREALRASAPLRPGYDDWGNRARNNEEVINMTEVLLTKFSSEDCTDLISDCCRIISASSTIRSSELKDCSLQELKSKFNKINLQEHHKIKVVPSRIYSMAINPMEEGILLAVGCKSGALGLWNVNLDGRSGDRHLSAFDYHVKPVSCLTFSQFEPQMLYSTSYDGTVRRFDLQQQNISLIYSTPEHSRDSHLSWHCEVKSRVLLVGHGSGYIARVDTREPDSKALLYKCHDRSVRTISLHPLQENIIATTSSAKRDVCIWDMRKMTAGKKTEQKFLSQVSFKKPISGAFFSPITGSKLLTTSYDDNISVFNCENLTKPSLQFKVAHNNQTGRWVTNFKAMWHPQREDAFIVGCMDKPRKLEIYRADEAQGGKVLQLLREPDLFTTIGAVAQFHPSLPVVAAGNASGYVHVFI